MPSTHQQRYVERISGAWPPIVAGLVAASVLFIAALVSITSVRTTAKGAIDQEVRDNLARLAAVTASVIDAHAHARLTDPEQQSTEAYRTLNAPLTEAIRSAEGVRFVYTLRAVDDQMRFVLDGTPIGDADGDGVEDHSFLMDIYEDPDPAAWEAIQDGQIVVTQEPYTDLWGTFLSGFAPIRLDDGTIDGVVGVDVSVDQYRARLAQVDVAAMRAMIPALVLSVLAGAGVWWAARRFVRFTEEIVEHREEAVRANNAKSSLLANISHELRTPLNAIIGFVSIAGDDRHSCMERTDAVATVKHNAEHLLTLINDLLDISKAEAGAISIEPTEIDLPELIERAVSPLRLRAMEKRIGFEVSGLDALPPRVVLDRTRVRQVLLNLLSNAVKFTDDGRVRLELSAQGGVLEMRVRDTGPGMTEAEIDQLFKPFTQLGTREKRLQGTGLGLTISRHLTELMGGAIGVESEPGVGSVFTARIPYGSVEAGGRAPSPERADWERLGGMRIAIAEDGPDNMRLLRMILKRAGAETVCFTDGGAARDGLLRDPGCCDMLITDWDMPVLSGEGLVRKLRESGWTRPIISLTAHAMPEQAEQCLGVGCDAHLTKPIDARRLIETCAVLMSQHGSGREAA